MKRRIKDKNWNITFEDREYLADLLSDYNISPEELCYQLTAYEKAGSINMERGLAEVLFDYGDDDEFELYEINDWYSNHNYDDSFIYSIDELDEVLSGSSPSKCINLSFYGDFNPNYPYFSFDGRGNLQSYSSMDDVLDKNSEAIEGIKKDRVSDLYEDPDFINDIENGTLQLIKQGY